MLQKTQNFCQQSSFAKTYCFKFWPADARHYYRTCGNPHKSVNPEYTLLSDSSRCAKEKKILGSNLHLMWNTIVAFLLQNKNPTASYSKDSGGFQFETCSKGQRSLWLSSEGGGLEYHPRTPRKLQLELRLLILEGYLFWWGQLISGESIMHLPCFRFLWKAILYQVPLLYRLSVMRVRGPEPRSTITLTLPWISSIDKKSFWKEENGDPLPMASFPLGRDGRTF